MKENLLKCGVIGVGYLGQHHARIYSELEGNVLAGVFESDADRAREISERHQCPVFSTIEELAETCDAISVVVPTDKHYEVAVPLLKAGCHLLIEKPICETVEQATEILAAANGANALVQVGHIEHFNPVMSYLEEVVTNPKYITAERLAPYQPRGTEVGVVLDLMIHDIGVVLQLVGSEPVDVRSVGVSVLSKTEDIANARIEFANGCVANLNVSRVSSKKVREIRVFQSTGYLSLDFMNQAGHHVAVGLEGLSKNEVPIEKGEPLKLELASFVESVKNRKDPKVGGELGKTALDLAIQITSQIRKTMD
ncbi:Gfo/Idh/MocA family protein [Candidatus Pelagisphaera phototrophica]|uniref:Gfo/Idh/MocA family protein n=1 Tax=Candidatus Pelagisphaera phototrophica TaxID=2684113 RepID=UPI0019F35317|nr:Gfo/Idh/MocA family oxidoreductase [Candidatus Pelagisphaera phototrophica]QXD30621.1 Gfo/Idh/MocA family oxidoreductase [Candidatus Pelagisphaera phototrophica]